MVAGIITDIIHMPLPHHEEVKEGGQGAQVFNLANPSRVPFSSLLSSIKTRLEPRTEVVCFAAWVAILEGMDREDEVLLELYSEVKDP